MRLMTIGLTAAAQDAVEAPPPPVDRKKRIASVWIPSVLAVGLLTSFTYLGIRIASAKPQPALPVAAPAAVSVAHAPVVMKEPLKPVPAMTPPPAPAAKATVQPMNFTIITPQSGEKYIQLAAVTTHAVLSYVDDLRQLALDPIVVAPGPTPELLRVMVGPFADQESLDRAKAQLEAAGRKYLVRAY